MKTQNDVQLTSNFSPVLPLEAVQSYLFALVDHGAVEGRIGQQGLIAELEPALDIIHHILAGAELKIHVEVVREPDTLILEELEQKRRAAEQKANEMNAMLGMSHVLV
jgi:hypothetical protein